ncbi:MAG: PLDc N-terminal domain-containing protein, partial [Candidatus Binatia bacterium]
MDLREPLLVSLLTLVATGTAAHALLYKRDPRAAFGWIAVCLFFPVAGPLLYFFFGINRARTRAKKLKGAPALRFSVPYERPEEAPALEAATVEAPAEGIDLARISSAVTRHSLVAGNRLE